MVCQMRACQMEPSTPRSHAHHLTRIQEKMKVITEEVQLELTQQREHGPFWSPPRLVVTHGFLVMSVCFAAVLLAESHLILACIQILALRSNIHYWHLVFPVTYLVHGSVQAVAQVGSMHSDWQTLESPPDACDSITIALSKEGKHESSCRRLGVNRTPESVQGGRKRTLAGIPVSLRKQMKKTQMGSPAPSDQKMPKEKIYQQDVSPQPPSKSLCSLKKQKKDAGGMAPRQRRIMSTPKAKKGPGMQDGKENIKRCSHNIRFSKRTAALKAQSEVKKTLQALEASDSDEEPHCVREQGAPQAAATSQDDTVGKSSLKRKASNMPNLVEKPLRKTMKTLERVGPATMYDSSAAQQRDKDSMPSRLPSQVAPQTVKSHNSNTSNLMRKKITEEVRQEDHIVSLPIGSVHDLSRCVDCAGKF